MAANYNKDELKNFTSEDFALVDKDEKIFDKKFETKPVGYFRDAMSRFARNKTNVIASIILFTMIFLAVIVPITTTKAYTGVHEDIRNLSPRWPIFERWGIMDGRARVSEVRVDRTTIDPETGLGLPYQTVPDYLPAELRTTFVTYRHLHIDMDTLTNEVVPCTGFGTRDSACYGGEVIFGFQGEHRLITVMSDDVFTFDPDENPFINVVIPANSNVRNMSVLVSLDGGDNYTKIDTFFDAAGADALPGTYQVEVFDVMNDVTEAFDSRIKVEFSNRTATIHEDVDLQFGDANTPVSSVDFDTTSSNFNTTIASQNVAEFDSSENSYIEFVIDEITEGATVAVLVLNQYGVYQRVGEITEAGTHQIFVFDSLTRTGEFNSIIRFALLSESDDLEITLESVSVYHDGEEEPHFHEYGWALARWTRASGEGTGYKSRINAEILSANFIYDTYGAAFGERRRTYGGREYDRLLEEYADRCEIVEHPYGNPDGWGFDSPDPERPCVFTRVEERIDAGSQIDPRTGERVFFYNYRVFINFGVLMGYDTPPYYIFGTNNMGQDMFALTWFGLRTSLMLGFIASFINITVGIIYGSISGYYGGKVDLVMERFSELIGRIPWLVTLSIFMALIGPGALSLILILIVSGWIGVAGVTRTQFYRYKGREYVLASRTLGAKDSRLIFRHILPNGIGTIITASILMIPAVIFTEAALSYLGFGIGHGQSFKLFGILELSGVSIGVLLSDGQAAMLNRPYLTIFPAIVISILMITFNLFGNALRDAFNPSLRGSE